MKRVLFSLVAVVLACGVASATIQLPDGTGNGVEIGYAGNTVFDNVTFSGQASAITITGYFAGAQNPGNDLGWYAYKDNAGAGVNGVQMFYAGVMNTNDGTTIMSATGDLSATGEPVYEFTFDIGSVDLSDMSYMAFYGYNFNGSKLNILTSVDGDNVHFNGPESNSGWGTMDLANPMAGDLAISIVPEPATMILLGLGGLMIRRKK